MTWPGFCITTTKRPHSTVWNAFGNQITDTCPPGGSVCLFSTVTQRNVEPVGQPVHVVLIRCEHHIHSMYCAVNTSNFVELLTNNNNRLRFQ